MQLTTTRIFRPVMNAGVVYARIAGSSDAMQSIGGLEEVKLSINEDIKKQGDFSRGGGGSRASVSRIESVTMSAALQDLNVVNIARAVFGTASSVAAATITGEPIVAHRGGLTPLAHLSPTSVVAKTLVATTGAVAGTGNGTLTLDGVAPLGQGATVGAYTVTCTVAAVDGGTFQVKAPDNTVLGTVVVGETFSGPIKFSIAAGLTDFVVADAFTVTVAGTAVSAAANYEVRPEGLFWLDDAPAIVNGQRLAVDYAHGGYDLVEALTGASPILEMLYAGVNEADNNNPSTVELFRVKLGATKDFGLIDKEFGTLQMEGEVMLDPTKTGVGVSRFFRKKFI